MGLIDRAIDRLFRGVRHRQKYPAPIVAPVGYDPTQDPDGARLAQLVGEQGGGGGDVWARLWEVLRSLWWAWLVIVVMAAFAWYWYQARPARATAAARATRTAIAARWTPTATAAPVTPTAAPTHTATATAAAAATSTRTRSTPTTAPTSTPTHTTTARAIAFAPTSTATSTPTCTPTPTATPIEPAAGAAATAAPMDMARLASDHAVAGESMAVVGQVSNGSVVRVLWEDGRELAKAAPGAGGNFATSFVVPHTTQGYHVVKVVWSAGKGDRSLDLVIKISVPPTLTPTWTPIPTHTPTCTPIPTATPITPTPTPYPTPIGGWPYTIYLPIVHKGG